MKQQQPGPGGQRRPVKPVFLLALLAGMLVWPYPVALAQTGAVDPIGHLVGQAFTFCSWARVPFEAIVEHADWSPGPSASMRATLVVQVTHTGGGATGAYITMQVRDETGRTYDFARAGSGVDVLELAREYGVLTPTMPVQSTRPARHLWTFVVAPDVQRLTLVQDPRYAC
jgi:hypothetical protein